jgi:hypothetical protein
MAGLCDVMDGGKGDGRRTGRFARATISCSLFFGEQGEPRAVVASEPRPRSKGGATRVRCMMQWRSGKGAGNGRARASLSQKMTGA